MAVRLCVQILGIRPEPLLDECFEVFTDWRGRDPGFILFAIEFGQKGRSLVVLFFTIALSVTLVGRKPRLRISCLYLLEGSEKLPPWCSSLQ